MINQLVVETLNITQEGIYSLYNFVTDNFKEYDLDTEYCLNIYKYFVCESRDMSDGSGAYIILLKFKKIFCSLRASIILDEIHIL
jgi:hypothetical protein